MTDPRDRKRYEQAVAMAWSCESALEMMAMRVVVTPIPPPNPQKTRPRTMPAVEWTLGIIPEDNRMSAFPNI